MFDGHGGANVARLASTLLHTAVLSAGLAGLADAARHGMDPATLGRAAKAAVLEGYRAADSAILARCSEEVWHDGAAAVTLWTLGRTVVVANVGDARAVLARRPPPGGGVGVANGGSERTTDGGAGAADANRALPDPDERDADTHRAPPNGGRSPANGDRVHTDVDRVPFDGNGTPADGNEILADDNGPPADGSVTPADGNAILANAGEGQADAVAPFRKPHEPAQRGEHGSTTPGGERGALPDPSPSARPPPALRALTLTREHRAVVPAERARIGRAGGWVAADGRLLGRIELSRSLGDAAFKKRGMTATPDVTVFEAGERDAFLLLGCDGFWGEGPGIPCAGGPFASVARHWARPGGSRGQRRRPGRLRQGCGTRCIEREGDLPAATPPCRPATAHARGGFSARVPALRAAAGARRTPANALARCPSAGVFSAQEAVDAAAAQLAGGAAPKAVCNRLLHEAVRGRACRDNCTVMFLLLAAPPPAAR